MSRRQATAILLGVAIAVLLVALILRAADVLSDDAVDWLAVVGLGLLAIGQAIRAATERSVRSVAILVLVIALVVVVLLD